MRIDQPQQQQEATTDEEAGLILASLTNSPTPLKAISAAAAENKAEWCHTFIQFRVGCVSCVTLLCSITLKLMI